MSNDPEINRKRKNSHELQIQRHFSQPDHRGEEHDENEFLKLSLSWQTAAARIKKQQPTQSSMPPPALQPSSPSLSMQFQYFQQQPPPPPPPQTQSPSQPPPSPPPPSQPPPSHQQTFPPYMSHIPIPDSSAQPIMQPVYRQEQPVGPSRPSRQRRNTSQEPREGKGNEPVPPPFPWATTQRATVYTLNYLISKQIFKISGEVQCKRCDRQYEMEFDLREKFYEVGNFIANNKSGMHDRAPGVWMNPVLPSCKICDQENCVKPVIPEDKDSINWLFLLLGQMLGCCTLDQLKYFCKHTKNHRTGAKDRVLFLTYLGLCKQLDPNGPFDR